MWIGLNPSTADEQQLDPTLRRIRGFSAAWGYTSFVMTNLFAFRATRPDDMKATKDAIGPENDAALLSWAERCDLVIAAWGVHGSHLGREATVRGLLSKNRVRCLGLTKSKAPRHPLYVVGTSALVDYRL